jgi:hypothetical protein
MNLAERVTSPWPLLFVLLLAGCGPSSEEIGASVLTAAPVVLFACSALLWTIWRPLEGPGAAYPWRLLLRSSLVSLVGPVIGVPILIGTGDSETPMLALVTYGSAVLAITILVWHVLRLAKVGRPVERALLGVYTVLTLPAFVFLLGEPATSHFHAAFLVVWIYAGWLGSVPAVFMVLTWIGTAIRNANRRSGDTPLA